MSMEATAASGFDELGSQMAQSADNIQNVEGPSQAHSDPVASDNRRSPASSTVHRPQAEPLHMSLNPPAMSSSPLTVPEPSRNHPQSPPLPWNLPRTDTAPQVEPRVRENPRPDNEPQSLIYSLLALVGYSGANAKARKELLSLFFNLGYSVVQFVVIVTLLAYSAHHESPTKPGLSEWAACDRPLGVWDSIWLVRVALGCLLSIWSWRRERAARQIQERQDAGEDIESPISPMSGRHGPTYRPPPRPMRTPTHPLNAHDAVLPAPVPVAVLPHSYAYSRLSLLSTFMSLAWFLTAHILEYTSINDCRFSSPHLWWLTFGILCILYLMILEIFLLGLLVFVLGPVIYLLWNIILLCLGRHPLQNPHYIKPEIGKLPKAVVDQIPLVLYIPPPPEDPTSGDSVNKPIPIPSPSYSYPPKSTPSGSLPKRRFAFLRSIKSRRSKGKDTANLGSSGEKNTETSAKRANRDQEKTTWEERWEPGEFPFVRLEGNRAVCAICLLDFEEPKKVGETSESETKHDGDAPGPTTSAEDGAAKSEASRGDDQQVQEIAVEDVTQEERDELRLDDASEGAQPLRLLFCGHVFHQTCVDPWLIDVSGRCPTCQRPVEIPESGKKMKRGRRTT